MRGLVFGLLVLVGTVSTAATIQVVANPVPKSGGHLRWALYNTQSSFENDGAAMMTGALPAVAGSAAFDVADLEPGTYVFTIYDDANDNGVLDKSMFGMPEEAFGISNIVKTLWSHPKWNDAKFVLTDSTPLNLPILLKMQ